MEEQDKGMHLEVGREGQRGNARHSRCLGPVGKCGTFSLDWMNGAGMGLKCSHPLALSSLTQRCILSSPNPSVHGLCSAVCTAQAGPGCLGPAPTWLRSSALPLHPPLPLPT